LRPSGIELLALTPAFDGRRMSAACCSGALELGALCCFSGALSCDEARRCLPKAPSWMCACRHRSHGVRRMDRRRPRGETQGVHGDEATRAPSAV
jgi:hypothetical protein